MERATKILILLFIAGIAYLVWSVFDYSDNPEVEREEDRMAISGNSMFPTLKNGDLVHFAKEDPSVGEIVIFTCLSPRCLPEPDEVPGPRLVKRLNKIENDCYTFLGDNPEESFDSRDFGQLCNEELIIEGIVTSIEVK